MYLDSVSGTSVVHYSLYMETITFGVPESPLHKWCCIETFSIESYTCNLNTPHKTCLCVNTSGFCGRVQVFTRLGKRIVVGNIKKTQNKSYLKKLKGE